MQTAAGPIHHRWVLLAQAIRQSRVRVGESTCILSEALRIDRHALVGRGGAYCESLLARAADGGCAVIQLPIRKDRDGRLEVTGPFSGTAFVALPSAGEKWGDAAHARPARRLESAAGSMPPCAEMFRRSLGWEASRCGFPGVDFELNLLRRDYPPTYGVKVFAEDAKPSAEKASDVLARVMGRFVDAASIVKREPHQTKLTRYPPIEILWSRASAYQADLLQPEVSFADGGKHAPSMLLRIHPDELLSACIRLRYGT